VECSVCGFSLDGPGHCPACGSENHPQDIDNAILDKVEINSREMENPEKDTGSTSSQSVDSGDISPIELPFGMEDAPLSHSTLAIPYGLDFAPN